LVASFAIAVLLDVLALHVVTGPVQIGVLGGLVLFAVLLSEARSRLLR